MISKPIVRAPTSDPEHATPNTAIAVAPITTGQGSLRIAARASERSGMMGIVPDQEVGLAHAG